MKEFAVKVSGSSDSLDLLSDVRNWFPGYLYESVPLDTSDSLKDLLIGGNEHGESKALVEENLTDKIRDDEPSLSLISEPPDLRNWISSYTYESPVLDTSDGLTESLFKEIKWEIMEGKDNKKKEENSEKIREYEAESSAKVLDSPNSPSFLSEPPGLQNWFTSYVYESPETGETVEFGDSLSIKEELTVEDSDTEEEDNRGIIRKTICIPAIVATDKFNSDSPEEIVSDEEKYKRKGTCFSLASVCYEGNLECELIGRTGNGSTKVMGEPGLKQGTLLYKPEDESAEMKSETMLEDKMQRRAGNTTKETHVASLFCEASRLKPIQRALQEPKPVITNGGKSAGRENNGHNKQMLPKIKKGNNENQSLGTVKDRCKDAKQQDFARGIKLQCSRTEGSSRLNDTKRRKVLAETTNLQHKGVTEVTGKWVCPQKNKPNKGPPLKQLCLNKWFNRL